MARATETAEPPRTAHECLQNALGAYQVTHIHAYIREALALMELTEEEPSAE